MDCETWADLLTPLLASIVGGALALGGIVLQQWLFQRKKNDLDNARKMLLTRLLKGAKGEGWMRIDTLSRVVGADLNETRRLLIGIDARGSLKEKEVWSLISRNPLPQNEDEAAQ